MDDSLSDASLASALQHRLLSGAQERRLALRAMRGDRAAREALVCANLRLVAGIARSHSGRGLPLADLFQHGVIGLLEAADRYDPTRGTRFSTYATYWVRMRISRAVERMQPLRLGSEAEMRRRRLHAVAGRLGGDADEEALAAATGLSIDEVGETLALMRRSVIASLDAPLGGGDTPLASLVEDRTAVDPEEQASAGIRARQIRLLLRQLPPRESTVLQMRFGFEDGIEHTLQEIAASLGLSRESIRLAQLRALASLAAAPDSQGLRELPDSDYQLVS